MKKFIIAVNAGINFNYAFIKIDNFNSLEPDFYLELMKSSFPNRDAVNKMLSEYRKASNNTLYSSNDLESLLLKKNNNPDVICVIVFDSSNQWSLLNG